MPDSGNCKRAFLEVADACKKRRRKILRTGKERVLMPSEKSEMCFQINSLGGLISDSDPIELCSSSSMPNLDLDVLLDWPKIKKRRGL